ncbi:MAG: sugar isomerase [Flavobacterium sp. BFFFF1]|uniref:lipopolysaccharide biosynthesis protein n=1 Tax=Flavobacterium sp. BFFFF1 TaxID=2015557 RepID=UPI000BD35C69|nr:oligosaccharide flippase family protein [Flavobacterium sp. BFFFF1]OYU79581.1 MAG: sugar isomerase [Flavobacterium sp. BFFFF1]
MGIVLRQSARNVITSYLGFGIGAINVMFLYTTFISKEHYGVVNFILSAANIVMPLMAFGVHNSLIRFFSYCKSEEEKERFMSFMLLIPLLFIIPICGLAYFFYDEITRLLHKNPEANMFLWLIPVIAVCMAYFEIFYAWVKVHMKSVFGNFINEVLVRLVIMGLLFSVHFGWMQETSFIYCLAGAYALQLFAMMAYAFKVRMPKITFHFPDNAREILGFSLFIIISGSVATLLLDFDKVMIPFYKAFSENAVYSLAIFIATVIAVPSRAMLQIIYPITVRLMSENKLDELNDLYKKSAITLQVFGGLIMLGIFLNINQMYRIIPGNYGSGTLAVFLIGISKFYDVILGNNNAIILNTKYYRWALFFGVLTVFMMVGLNMIFIPLYGINGSALATLITVVVYNSVKLFFVVNKLDLFPFTINTIKSFAIITTTFLVFYFWDFPFHPIINIVLKSGLITVIYVYVNYRMRISAEINDLINATLGKLKFR